MTTPELHEEVQRLHQAINFGTRIMCALAVIFVIDVAFRWSSTRPSHVQHAVEELESHLHDNFITREQMGEMLEDR